MSAGSSLAAKASSSEIKTAPGSVPNLLRVPSPLQSIAVSVLAVRPLSTSSTVISGKFSACLPVAAGSDLEQPGPAAIAAIPRTTETKSLRIEKRFGDATRAELLRFGHQAEFIDDFSDVVGHAAAIQRDPASGVLSGAADPRGEGIAAGW